MKLNTKYILLISIGVIIIGIFIYKSMNKKSLIENFTIHPFTIHNHLNENIILKINKLSKPIQSKSAATLTPRQVNEFLKNGNIKKS